jgi:hypothetical protein
MMRLLTAKRLVGASLVFLDDPAPLEAAHDAYTCDSVRFDNAWYADRLVAAISFILFVY